MSVGIMNKFFLVLAALIAVTLVLSMIFIAFTTAKESKYINDGNKEKSVKWGRNDVLSRMICVSSVVMALFCLISWFSSLEHVILPFLMLAIGAFICYSMVRGEVKNYWKKIHSEEAEENKKNKIKENRASIEQLILAWFDETTGQRFFDGFRFLMYELVIEDPILGEYFCVDSSEGFKHSPLRKMKLGSVVGIIPSIFSLHSRGDNNEILMINFETMDDNLISQISNKVGGTVKRIRIVTQKSNFVYRVFVRR